MNISGQEPSYEAGPRTTTLLSETIGANFERTAATHPDIEALVDALTGQRWTYHQLDNEINVVAKALIAQGISAGDRIGLWAANCAEWVVLQYATAKVGAILVTINPAYRTHELSYVARHSSIRMLFAATTFKTSDYREMIDKAQPEIPDLEKIVFIDSPDWQTFRAYGDTITTAELRQRMATLRPDDPINIQYTSGTTGSPKGAVLTHTNILNNGYFVADTIKLRTGDRLCIPVPFYQY